MSAHFIYHFIIQWRYLMFLIRLSFLFFLPFCFLMRPVQQRGIQSWCLSAKKSNIFAWTSGALHTHTPTCTLINHFEVYFKCSGQKEQINRKEETDRNIEINIARKTEKYRKTKIEKDQKIQKERKKKGHKERNTEKRKTERQTERNMEQID